MKLLLDTHTFLWWNMGDARLSEKARELIADGENVIYLSAASAWEIAIKYRQGSLELPEPPDRYVISRISFNNFLPLPVQMNHALHVSALPEHHRDPFDRLLIAQAELENLLVLTADPAFTRYGVAVVW